MAPINTIKEVINTNNGLPAFGNTDASLGAIGSSGVIGSSVGSSSVTFTFSEESLLLEVSLSCSLPVTIAVFSNTPISLILTVTVKVTDSPLAKSPIVQTPVAES